SASSRSASCRCSTSLRRSAWRSPEGCSPTTFHSGGAWWPGSGKRTASNRSRRRWTRLWARSGWRWRPGNSSAQVLLDEPRAEVDVDLHQRLLADAAKAVDLARLDHQNVARSGFELLPVDL